MSVTRESIAEIFRAEEASGRKARTIADVPNTYDCITPEWLTAVLCRDAPGAQVVEFRAADFSSGSSNRARLYVRYNEAGQRAGLLLAIVVLSPVLPGESA